MHEKFRIFNFKTAVSGLWDCVIGLVGTLITQDILLHLPMAFQDDTYCSSKTFINMCHTTLCPDPDRIINLHQCEHLKSGTKEY